MRYYVKETELFHVGVKGMKWGRRKARPTGSGAGRRGGATQATTNPAAQKQARKSKAKRALKIGAAVAGTALAAYGTYKISKLVRDKRAQKAIESARRADELWRRNVQQAMHQAQATAVNNGVKIKSQVIYDHTGRIISR